MSDFSNQNSQNFSQSSAFAAALQRAKQIAAKIHPGGNQPVKRSIEDDSGPESKKFGGQPDYNNAHSPTGMSPAAMQAAAQAAAVAARLSQINNNSNSNQPAGGAQDPVQRARDLISKMVNQQGGGGHNGPMDNGNHGGGGRGGFGGGPGNFNNQPFQEIMIPGSKVGLIIGKGGETIKQLQEKSGAKMVIIQDGPGQEMEKPLRISGDPQKVEHAKQLVFELIQEKDNYNAQRQQQQQQAPMNGTEQAEVFVPKSAVGVVIGKGGDMIKKIQGESGCKLQFIQGRGDGPGDRRCIVQGSRAQVEEGKRMIEELIESVQRREQGGGGRGGRGGDRDDRGDRGDRQHRGGRDNHDNGNSGQYGNDFGGPQVTREEYTFTVPVNKCGIIIGRGGDTIKQINQQSGAHTEMDRKASANQTNEKTFTTKGEPHQIEEAKRLIQDKINMEINLVYVGTSTAPAQQYQNNGQQNAYGQSWGGYQQQSWDQTPQVQASPASAAAVQQQQQPGGGGGGGGQADYSQQWIEYYRQMGMHREAEMIEQQVKARQAAASQQGAAAAVAATVQTTQVVATSNAGAQQASGGGGGGGGQADYSAEWAEYYRRLGRIDEAEAIEKQIAANKAVPSGAGSGGQPGGAAGQQFGGAGGAPGGAGGGNPQQMAAQQAAGGFNAQQFQQYYAGAAAAGGQPGGYQGYPYGGGYPGQQGGQPGQQQGGQGPDKN